MLEAHGAGGAVSPAEAEAAEIDIKYSGFIRRQVRHALWAASGAVMILQGVVYGAMYQVQIRVAAARLVVDLWMSVSAHHSEQEHHMQTVREVQCGCYNADRLCQLCAGKPAGEHGSEGVTAAAAGPGLPQHQHAVHGVAREACQGVLAVAFPWHQATMMQYVPASKTLTAVQHLTYFGILESQLFDDLVVLLLLSVKSCHPCAQVRPRNVGQASRIGGVNPADISNLLIHLEVLRRRSNVRPVNPSVLHRTVLHRTAHHSHSHSY